jgi:two-component system cell cycle sensor histidine kinase/response regulator CckA
MHYLQEDNKAIAGGDYILVVDDEPMFRTMVVRSLRARGYTVLEADRAEAALETTCRQAPALVVSDVFMKGMTGFELLAGLTFRSS